MSQNHTPEPWEIAPENEFSIDGCVAANDGVVASGWKVIVNPEMAEMAIIVVDMNQPNCWDDELLDANVNIILAAPALLKAAETALQALIGVDKLLHQNGMMKGVTNPAIEPLRAAISKAKASSS